MADAQTANYQLVKPEVGASADTWGEKLNANADTIDARLKADADAAAAADSNANGRVSKAGDVITGDLILREPTPVLRLQQAENGPSSVLSRASDGSETALDGETPAGLPCGLQLNPKPAEAARDALVRLFRGTVSTGRRALQIFKGDGTATLASEAAVNAAGDGLDWSGKHKYAGRVEQAGTFGLPLVIGAARLWVDGARLRFKMGSDPTAAADGTALGAGVVVVESTPAAFVANSAYSLTHGLGALPRLWTATLRCTTAEFGYLVDDEILVDNNYISDNFKGGLAWANATTVGVAFRSAPYIVAKAGGSAAAITPASWSVVLRAFP